MKKHIFTLSFVAISILFVSVLSSCGDVKPRALGFETEIIVIADTVEYMKFEESLTEVFSSIIYTPQPENLFYLKRKPFNSLRNNERKKNILIIAPLNSKSEVGNYINSIISPEVKAKIEKDSVYVINKYDLWAKGQLVMIITGKNIETINKNISENKDNLLHYFQKVSDARLYESIYNSQYEKKDVEAMLLKNYGWIVYVQADYYLAKNVPEDKFVWLRRNPNGDMERWLMVHWIENATPEYLNKDSVIALRNRITQKHYRSTDDSSWVEIAFDYLTFSEVNFQGKYAIMTQGLWRMSDQSMGGPFINYTFYDEKTKRLYLLDGSIFAPRYQKRTLIQQMNVTLQSFRLKEDLSKQQLETLKKEMK